MTRRRLILALTDGLRPEAITRSRMPALHTLSRTFTAAADARTIRPSTTVAALASLATGVSPQSHQLLTPGLGFLHGPPRLCPVARELGRRGVAADVVTPELPLAAGPLVRALATAAGARRVRAAGHRARETAAAADRIAGEPGTGLVFVYLPDCDRAGHEHGWMSTAYLEAAAGLDAAIALLAQRIADALLVVVADHGGGGVIATEHHHPHPLNQRIPLVLAGPGVARAHRLDGPVSLLDVAATVLWWFGAPVPQCYEGRPLLEAFAPALLLEAVG